MNTQWLKTDVMRAFPPAQKTHKRRLETSKFTRKKAWCSSDLAFLQGCRDKMESMFIKHISIQKKPKKMGNQDSKLNYTQ
jgi:hypothetical protein